MAVGRREVRETGSMIRLGCITIAALKMAGIKCKDREKPLGADSNPLSKASKEMGTSVLSLQKVEFCKQPE